MEVVDFEEELKLAEQMKEYCNASVGKQWKETEPEKAAEIIYKIALIYKRRSPDKISLIKCVGLLNAAIFRKPLNFSQIQADLADVCRHILAQANADIRHADLIRKASLVKEAIRNLRNEVDTFLKKIVVQNLSNPLESEESRIFLAEHNLAKQACKTKSIQYLNYRIAEKYKQIMADLSKFCEEVMGKPPCEFAVVGMGSLARNEITPFSDFEHIILLFDDKNYESHLEYFRWYSVVFHVTILNLQESIIPSLNIKSLNWYFDACTTRGVSFDGMMPHACKFPLGRFEKTEKKPFVTELIKPVSQMLEYLSFDADLKNGYHLADILTKTCLVYGNETIFVQFINGIEKYRDCKSKQERVHEVERQVKNDLDKFSLRFRLAKLNSYDTINVKHLVYRSSTLFVTALARIHNISENSCFHTIQKLADVNVISQTTQVKLSYAVAIACETRLRVYTEKKSQCDNAIDLKEKESISKFVNIVGTENTISYFQIAYCLQCQVAKELNFTKFHFYSDLSLINFTIGLVIKMRPLQLNILKNNLKISWSLKDFNFDDCIQQLQTEPYLDDEKFINKLDKKLIESLAFKLFFTNIYDEALEFYQQILAIHKKESKDESRSENIAETYLHIGACLMEMENYDCSLEVFKKAKNIYQNISYNQHHDEKLANALHSIGSCLTHMYHYDDALIHLNLALKIKLNLSLDQKRDGFVATITNSIGECLFNMQRYGEALVYFEQALKISFNLSLDLQTDCNLASSLSNIGSCLIRMHRFVDALIYLKHSLKICKNLSHDQWLSVKADRTLNGIGECLRNLHQYDEALIHLKQALAMKYEVSLDPRNDRGIAATLTNIGTCLFSKKHFHKALIYYKQSLKISANVSFDQQKDLCLAFALHGTGNCLAEMHYYDHGLDYLNQAFKAFKSISFDQRKDVFMAATMNDIGHCLAEMQLYDGALTRFKQSLEIKINVSPNQRKDSDVASSYKDIGFCLWHMHHYDNALIYLKQSLKIYKNIALNEQMEDVVGTICKVIGICLSEIHQHDDALIYLKKALEIYTRISLDQLKDENIASTLNSIGKSFAKLQDYKNALAYLKQSLDIKKSISLDQQADKNVATISKNIALCLMLIHHYDEAMIYLRQFFQMENKYFGG